MLSQHLWAFWHPAGGFRWALQPGHRSLCSVWPPTNQRSQTCYYMSRTCDILFLIFTIPFPHPPRCDLQGDSSAECLLLLGPSLRQLMHALGFRKVKVSTVAVGVLLKRGKPLGIIGFLRYLFSNQSHLNAFLTPVKSDETKATETTKPGPHLWQWLTEEQPEGDFWF